MNSLQQLRISIARMAQAAGVNSPLVSDEKGNPLPYEQLAINALVDRGWNTLVGECVEMANKNRNFVQHVAGLHKWGSGDHTDEIEAPSDGTDDSHESLMGLIDDARELRSGSHPEPVTLLHAA